MAAGAVPAARFDVSRAIAMRFGLGPIASSIVTDPKRSFIASIVRTLVMVATTNLLSKEMTP